LSKRPPKPKTRKPTKREPNNSVCEAPDAWRELADRLIQHLKALNETGRTEPLERLERARDWIESDEDKPDAYQLTEGLVWGTQYAGKSRLIARISSAAWAINNIAAYELGFEDYETALDILTNCNDELPKKQRLATLEAPEETDDEDEETT
jgi:hypothetical protein